MRQQGFSLIEVLIALVVLSVGLLGLASLHTTTLKVNNDAYLRTQANILAYNIIDRMRANSARATAGAYDTGFKDSVAKQQCVDSACTPDELAKADLYFWKSALKDPRNGLPVGEGRVRTIKNGDGTVQVSVWILWANHEQSNPHHDQSSRLPELRVDTAL